MDGLVPLIVVVRALLFCSGIREVILVRSRMPGPEVVLDGIKDFVDGEPEQSELFCWLVGLE